MNEYAIKHMGRRLYLIGECQLINIKGGKKITICNYTVIVDSGKNHQWMVELESEYLMKNRISK